MHFTMKDDDDDVDVSASPPSFFCKTISMQLLKRFKNMLVGGRYDSNRQKQAGAAAECNAECSMLCEQN